MLNTGRLLQHWHTGSMTRRSFALDAISPRPEVYVNPDDAAELGLADGEMARVTSRRGTIVLETRLSHREARGNCFIPFHFREAAANLLTIDEIDPVGKIPEFKFCAVRIEPAGRTGPSRARPCPIGVTAEARRAPGVEARAGKFPGPSLIPALHAIQERVGWLPREELEALAREVRRPLYEIEGLISFYPHFRTEPPPKVALHACHDLSCWLQGADAAARGAARALRRRRRRRAHRGVLPRPVRRGAGGGGQRVPGRGRRRRRARRGGPDRPPGRAGAPRLRRRRSRGPTTRTRPGRSGTRRCGRCCRAELSADQVITALQESGLRGMGGAGFPTGRKWGLVAAQAATPKYAICNADESEPGTFKDRQILAEQPHLVLEGLLLGMAAIGAEEGWVFIRHEYGQEEAVIRREIETLRAAGLVGADAAGSGRRLSVEVFTSPGGYILGEESALIECMEGHRGEPRNKPPFPGVYGLWGQPTLMNSVETFAHVPVITLRGADWWKRQGTGGGTGLKFFAVSGHVERPGVYCVPMGSTARDLLELAGGVSGGRAVGAIQPGGASSNFLGPDQLDVPLELRHAGRGRVDARLGRAGGDGRGHRPARGGHERAALLPRRVLRQVRPVPGRLDQGAPDPDRPARRGRRPGRRERARSASSRRPCADLDLRAGPGRAGPGGERARAASRDGPMTADARGAGSSSPPARSPRPWPASGPRGARRPRPSRWPQALHRVPAAPVTAPHALPGFARSTVDGYAVRAADTYGVVRRAARLSGRGRRGPDGRRARRRGRPRHRRSACPPAACCRPAPTRW